MKAHQPIRVTASAGGVRLEWLWWRSWQVVAVIALVVALVIGDPSSAIISGGLAVYVGWLVYMSSLTVEADGNGVSLRRWRSPGRRCRWRDIADVTVQERTNWGSRLPTKSYFCVLVLRSGRTLRIDAGLVGSGRRDDAALVKEHIDQVRGLWDPSHE